MTSRANALELHVREDDDECGEGHHEPREVDGRGQGIPPESVGQIPDNQSEHGTSFKCLLLLSNYIQNHAIVYNYLIINCKSYSAKFLIVK